MADISSIKLPNGSSYNFKDATGRSNATSYAVKSTYLVTENKSKDNVTISANSSKDIDVTVTKTGYTAIGIVGITVVNASSDGIRADYCHESREYLFGTPVSTARVTLRNHYPNGSSKVKVTFVILYTKTG